MMQSWADYLDKLRLGGPAQCVAESVPSIQRTAVPQQQWRHIEEFETLGT